MRFLFFILFSFSILAQDKVSIVAVGEAEEEKSIISIATPILEGLSENNETKEFFSVLKNDFSFYKHKFIIKEVSIKLEQFATGDLANWKALQFRYTILSRFVADQGGVRLDLKAYDVSGAKEIFNYSQPFTAKENIREFSHKLADELFKSITGNDSIFTSRIVFVSDKLSRGQKVIKELYIMDFDGRNIRRLTNHQSIVISPSISHDNKKVLYSVIKVKNGRQNIDLYMIDLESKKISLVSAKNGINSGAVFSGDDQRIYLTLSYTGNADIYEMVLETGALKRITNHFSDDVDPSITADGGSMCILSGRPGAAMIYTLDPRGEEKNVKRISFVGKFNATPVYNPDGSEIVFASWVDNRFDIYKIGADGRNLSRLTKNFGSNEEPSYSKDGEFIAFSSQRVLSRKKAIQNLYIMTRDGEILGNITDNFGACTSPRWSK